jgi:hypothetical protein
MRNGKWKIGHPTATGFTPSFETKSLASVLRNQGEAIDE